MLKCIKSEFVQRKAIKSLFPQRLFTRCIIMFSVITEHPMLQSSSWQVLYILKFNYTSILIYLRTFKDVLGQGHHLIILQINYTSFFLKYSFLLKFWAIYLIPLLILIILFFLSQSSSNDPSQSIDPPSHCVYCCFHLGRFWYLKISSCEIKSIALLYLTIDLWYYFFCFKTYSFLFFVCEYCACMYVCMCPSWYLVLAKSEECMVHFGIRILEIVRFLMAAESWTLRVTLTVSNLPKFIFFALFSLNFK